MRKPSILPRSFYLHPPDEVSRNLLGKLITRNLNGERLTGRIVELEAYFGLDDPASHAFPGKDRKSVV